MFPTEKIHKHWGRVAKSLRKLQVLGVQPATKMTFVNNRMTALVIWISDENRGLHDFDALISAAPEETGLVVPELANELDAIKEALMPHVRPSQLGRRFSEVFKDALARDTWTPPRCPSCGQSGEVSYDDGRFKSAPLSCNCARKEIER